MLEVLARTISQEKEIKDIQIGKINGEVSLYPDDVMVYAENPKVSTAMTKLLELTNNSAKFQDTKSTPKN